MLWVGIYPSFFVKVPKATAIKIFIYQGGYCDKHPKTLCIGVKEAGRNRHQHCGWKETSLLFSLSFLFFFVRVPKSSFKWVFFSGWPGYLLPYFVIEYNKAWIVVRVVKFNKTCIFYCWFVIMPLKPMRTVLTCRAWITHWRQPDVNQYSFLRTAITANVK